MTVAGFVVHAADIEQFDVQVYLSQQVQAYFEVEGRKGNRNERPVRKVKTILTKLKQDGLNRVRDSAQFKREGKFASGRKVGGEQVVWEAKNDQVRVYGGPVATGGKEEFYFVEAVTKKRDKADPEILERVAKRLGVIADELAQRD